VTGSVFFRDRHDAGAALAARLAEQGFDDPIVLGLPRGGVPVAFEVAQALGAPLDVIVVRKLGAPLQSELAIGAIASGGVQILNDCTLNEIHPVSDADLERIIRRETAELGRREFAYRGCAPYPNVTARDVILVDDGMATGATMCAAIQALRKKCARRVVVAVPVASPHALNRVRSLADDVICLDAPTPFFAVGDYYRLFDQTSDEAVRELLGTATSDTPPRANSG
jgi:putative phosphoribosyl transferase